jgi:hypothetical protein
VSPILSRTVIMRSPWLHVARILCALTAPLLSACFSFQLPPLEHPAEVQRLLNIPDVPMALRLHVEEPSSSVGYQFVGALVPVTRVYAPHIERDIATHLAIEAAARRYKLQPELGGTTTSYPHLTVNVSDLRISGYDLIFVRRPSASITLTGILELPNHPQRRCETHAEDAATTRFAFSTELNMVLQDVLRTSTRELFDCLGL